MLSRHYGQSSSNHYCSSILWCNRHREVADLPYRTIFFYIPGIKEIRSFSRFGLSLVTIVFKDEVDVYWARQQVAEKKKKKKRIQQIQGYFHWNGTPELGPVSTGLGEIYQYVVKAAKSYESKYGPTELPDNSRLDRKTSTAWCRRCSRSQFIWWKGQSNSMLRFHPIKLNSISLSLEDVLMLLSRITAILRLIY